MHRVLRFIIATGLAVAVPRAAGAADGVLDTTFAGDIDVVVARLQVDPVCTNGFDVEPGASPS